MSFTLASVDIMELQLPTDTGNQLISFNVAALQSMMQAVAREVAEKVNVAAAGRSRCIWPIVHPLTVLTVWLIDMHRRSNWH